MSLPRLPALLLLLCMPTLARAQDQTVLLASSDPRSAQLFEALDLELRGYGVLLVARPAPDGITGDAQEASARRLLTLLAARAALWVEDSEPVRVRVVAADRGEVLEAPLPVPLAQLGPRLFAAVAGSVVLKALQAPPAVSPTRESPAPQTVVSAPASLDWRPRSPRHKPQRTRFFLRAGLALGLARVHSMASACRSRDPVRAQFSTPGATRLNRIALAAAALDSSSEGVRCPKPGSALDRQRAARHSPAVSRVLDEAAQRLQHVLGLSPERAARAVAEVIDCFGFDVEQYVQLCHDQLHAQGVPNAEIYDRIAAELAGLRFKAPPLSARQIRRRIYG